mmetsp:Transcript_35469/g.97989  ORF Transcript_35469/g.97989 Transcript_35469/m.97989 type:complete len:216 (+) Transcript_35469:818-1465(+)
MATALCRCTKSSLVARGPRTISVAAGGSFGFEDVVCRQHMGLNVRPSSCFGVVAAEQEAAVTWRAAVVHALTPTLAPTLAPRTSQEPAGVVPPERVRPPAIGWVEIFPRLLADSMGVVARTTGPPLRTPAPTGQTTSTGTCSWRRPEAGVADAPFACFGEGVCVAGPPLAEETGSGELDRGFECPDPLRRATGNVAVPGAVAATARSCGGLRLFR